VDLRKRFGIPIEPHHKARVLVVDFEGKRVGLIVDAANEVLRIPEDEIVPPPTVLAENEINYVTGLGKVGGRLIILVDLAKLLERGHLVPAARTIAALAGEAEEQTQFPAEENTLAQAVQLADPE
jgi:chemotaxis signal transduction protein